MILSVVIAVVGGALISQIALTHQDGDDDPDELGAEATVDDGASATGVEPQTPIPMLASTGEMSRVLEWRDEADMLTIAKAHFDEGVTEEWLVRMELLVSMKHLHPKDEALQQEVRAIERSLQRARMLR